MKLFVLSPLRCPIRDDKPRDFPSAGLHRPSTQGALGPAQPPVLGNVGRGRGSPPGGP